MPIYEFRCTACRKRTSVFLRSVSAEVSAACEHCGSRRLERLFSRVAVHRSGDDGGFDEASLADVDEGDPRSMAKWVRKMSREMGEPLDAEMEGELERMEAGELPDDDDSDDGFEDDFAGVD
ncbi:MAG TPA: zinc ribbon domain-containing protein [Dehalococcoidia bacterium]